MTMLLIITSVAFFAIILVLAHCNRQILAEKSRLEGRIDELMQKNLELHHQLEQRQDEDSDLQKDIITRIDTLYKYVESLAGQPKQLDCPFRKSKKS